MDSPAQVHTCLGNFKQQALHYLGLPLSASRINAHSKFEGLLAILRSRYRLNNLEITLAMALLFECDQEVAKKLHEVLREVRRAKTRRASWRSDSLSNKVF
ncbi:hypothetical protein IPA_02750 [Ignicoccus pacificus DSM 13166]|uniref:Uncharacterized protein n=1 Tax=Ignicoccus pacificus DSM 13166 TaxID=940294 RepID=A0A977KBT6_9CREN|nr:hypothetical protein IPA_02750 [Ignicoccus pacificus DSM 13166]